MNDVAQYVLTIVEKYSGDVSVVGPFRSRDEAQRRARSINRNLAAVSSDDNAAIVELIPGDEWRSVIDYYLDDAESTLRVGRTGHLEGPRL